MESFPVFIIDAIILPPAPTPSFANPCENALSPENLEFSSLGLTDITGISVNPRLENSKFSGLKAFSQGFAKEGVGAGGSIIASMIKTGNDSAHFLTLSEKEYGRLFTSL